MRENMSHKYALVVEGRKVGPFDRRTVIGMRVKKMLEGHQVLIRDDGLQMTVAELVADRLEMADAPVRGLASPAPPAASSGVWPVFVVNFGGNALRAGAFGFCGVGEMRYQGDLLRMTGQRRDGLLSMSEDRIKLPLSALQSVRYQGNSVEFLLKPDQPYDEARRGQPAVLTLDNEFAIQELKDLLKLGA